MTDKYNFHTNPGLAAVLSFIWNGLGQIYNGQIRKGLTIMFVSTISMLIVIVGAVLVGQFLLMQTQSIHHLIIGLCLLGAGIISIAILGIYNIYDAYNTASRRYC